MTKIVYLVAGLVAGLLLGVAVPRITVIAAGPQDPAKMDPQMYKVILENEHLRAIDVHVKAGASEPLHSHPNGVFVYFFTDANVRSKMPDGTTKESHNHAGEVLWRDPVTHQGENMGPGEIHTLIVEPQSGK